MLKLAYLCLLCAFVVSCSSSKYVIVAENDLKHVNWTTNLERYTPILQSEVDNSELLKILLECCKQNKTNQARKKLESYSDSNDVLLAKSICEMASKKYDASLKWLNKIDKDYLPALVQLMKIDIFYEKSKQTRSVNIDFMTKQYQILLDKYPDYCYLGELVKVRMRHVRYNQ